MVTLEAYNVVAANVTVSTQMDAKLEKRTQMLPACLVIMRIGEIANKT